jgi:class 3 adenylate cyclase
VIADAFPEVTVLFADLVDFTRRSQRSSPAQVVACATFGPSWLVLIPT